MRKAAILGLIVIAALLPVVALPLAIVRVEATLIVVATVDSITASDAPTVALLSLTLFRAPPSL